MCIFHKWGKWEDIDVGEILRVKDESKVGRYIVQERVCEKCNKKELNQLRA